MTARGLAQKTRPIDAQSRTGLNEEVVQLDQFTGQIDSI